MKVGGIAGSRPDARIFANNRVHEHGENKGVITNTKNAFWSYGMGTALC